jgi:hypothetical protein
MSFSGKRPRFWAPPGNLEPSSMPIIGGQARRQIEEVKVEDRRLAKRLTRKIVEMVDAGVLRDAKLVPDSADIGPRFLVDLLEDYVAVYWVVFPEGREIPVIWVEQVKLREQLEAELLRLAPSQEAEETDEADEG